MKIRLFAGVLADAVSYTAKALPSRPPVPVMAGILLTTGDNGLRLSAADGEVYTSATLSAEIAADGQALVPGRLFNDICGKLPKGAEVDLEADGARLTLLCGSARFTLPLLPIEEYPAMPAIPDAVARLDAEAFGDAVAQVAVAVGRDDTLPALTGIQLRLTGALLVLAASDRYRVGRREITVHPTGTLPAPAKKRRKPEPDEGADPAAETSAVLVPGQTLADAARALTGEHTVTLHWSDALFALTIPGRTYMTRQLGAEYPKIDALLPTAADFTIALPVAEAIAAVQRVALVATRNTPIRLVLDSTGEHLIVEGGSGDDAQASDRIPMNILDGDPQSAAGDGAERYVIAFNPVYLTDGLKALGTSEARLDLRQPTKSAVLRAGGDIGDSYLHLLMPVRISG
ncbi:DNA polymerase III subunit beta [Kitasatospora sp. NBC_00240]|uniref:DNA polymerase III subunit beta n=1 Tax=Kitasatospora sp. NBC_00240 TaxID=2903567 RepID=UPI00224F98AD|nr:DNA polymerase III subunit beta [Kitasatospora sp. NBC_00240]MCX5216140.1 DNA polymerase III subunit beta [Kitasatospora sp. NBC_00240]